MVTFIGGYACTGKTKLANRLMKEFGLPYFSIDYLKMGLYRSNEDCGFTPLDEDDHIAKILWPMIREMAFTYIENGQDMVIEGCYIMPEFVTDIDHKYLKEMNFVFIGFSEDYISEHFDKSILANKGIIEDRTLEDERSIWTFIQGHLNLRKRVESLNLPYYLIRKDYLKEMEVVLNEIGSFYERGTV